MVSKFCHSMVNSFVHIEVKHSRTFTSLEHGSRHKRIATVLLPVFNQAQPRKIKLWSSEEEVKLDKTRSVIDRKAKNNSIAITVTLKTTLLYSFSV
jgi:hypothetical protein